jgi:hypothetical protein
VAMLLNVEEEPTAAANGVFRKCDKIVQMTKIIFMWIEFAVVFP